MAPGGGGSGFALPGDSKGHPDKDAGQIQELEPSDGDPALSRCRRPGSWCVGSCSPPPSVKWWNCGGRPNPSLRREGKRLHLLLSSSLRFSSLLTYSLSPLLLALPTGAFIRSLAPSPAPRWKPPTAGGIRIKARLLPGAGTPPTPPDGPGLPLPARGPHVRRPALLPAPATPRVHPSLKLLPPAVPAAGMLFPPSLLAIHLRVPL